MVKERLIYRPYFTTKDVKIGKNVSFGKNVIFNCKRVRIGDGVIFQDNITINSDVYEIGDYGTIYNHCFFPGPGSLVIGHNFWLGTSSIIDSQGETEIGSNVGIGAHSQLWGHMIFGDVMYGSRFHSIKKLTIEDDVWLVGHCLVSPVRIGKRSVVLLGSLITKDIEADRVYAGVPARDITDKVGPPFKITPVQERVHYLEQRLQEFLRAYGLNGMEHKVKIVTKKEDMSSMDKDITILNAADRTYTKIGTELEFKLIRFLLPDAKFVPVNPPGHD